MTVSPDDLHIRLLGYTLPSHSDLRNLPSGETETKQGKPRERKQVTKPHFLTQLGYILAWLGLTVIATLTAWQLHVALLYLAALLIETPSLRPTGWSTNTLAAVSRLSLLIWGSLWLFFIMYLEHQLREAVQERRLLQRSGRYALGLLFLYGIGYLITG